MHRLIKKHLTGGQVDLWGQSLPSVESQTTQYFNNILKNSNNLKPTISNTLMGGFKMPTTLPYVSTNQQTPSQLTSFTKNVGSGIETLGKDTISSAAENAPQLMESGIQMLGGKKADVSSGLENGFSQVSNVAWKVGLKSGNPYAIAAAAALKGLDLVNQFGGKTANKQETTGIDTGGYATQSSALAGKKFTLFGGGARKAANRLTNRTDFWNTQAADVTYNSKQDTLANTNSWQDILSQNQQSLFGGLNTKAIIAKNGAKIKELVKSIINKKPNVIPEGALHARKHNLPDDISEQITEKGIPVVTFEDGGEVTQHAEIEKNEIIFTKEVTDKLEELYKKYNESDNKDEVAIDAGKLLVTEILENTDDRTGLINEVK